MCANMPVTKGLSEYPLLRFSQIKGLAVGLVRRYPLYRKTELILVFWNWARIDTECPVNIAITRYCIE